MRVLKFGGTSVGSPDNIHKVIAVIAKQAQKEQIAVVVSAISGITNQLILVGNLALHKIDPVHIEKDLAIIALVGERMKSHQGISGRIFSTLGKNNVNIRAIAQGASEKNISAVIASKNVKKALNSLHERFFEDQRKQLNLFIMRVDNVGSKLLTQIQQQEEYLSENLNLNLRVIGLSNSRTMYFNEDGVDLLDWQSALKDGKKAEVIRFRES